jgi:pimeloyl-ACP methyl ester carboxylesterase
MTDEPTALIAASPPALHVDIHRGDGPPVLLVHGVMGGRALWAANIEALRTVATPVVVELYGHGRSPTPVGAQWYTPQAYVAQFESIRNELGAERWTVIGQSLGAALTLRYALDHPDRIVAHVMTNSMSALSKNLGDDGGLETAAQRIEERGLAGLIENRINPARSHRIVAPVREALAADQHLLDPAGIAAAVRHTVAGASQRARVAQNRVRTVIVAGSREVAFEEPCSYALAHMPLVEVVRLVAGHSPNAEIPEQFNVEVTRLLRGD